MIEYADWKDILALIVYLDFQDILQGMNNQYWNLVLD